jgi:glycosyltransferase involved in cell wall biosynthesis
MKILMVLEVEFPEDNRVEKEIRSLMDAGHDITIACLTREGRPVKESYDGYSIRRKPISGRIYKLGAASLVLPAYFKFWYSFLYEILDKESFDCIHVHDLPLASVGYRLKEKYRLKIVCDQQEYYSNWIIYTAHYNTFAGRIVKLLSNWKKYERKYLNLCDLVITVEEPLRQCYILDVGVPPEKIITVPNTPLQSVFNQENVDPEIVHKYRDDFVLFYAGNIDILRGIDIPISALPELIQHIPNIKVVIAGIMRKNCDPVRQAGELGVTGHVEYIGWIPIRNLPSYMAASDICFHVPRVIRDENNNTVATKVYQYLIMQKPIIAGAGKMLKELVEKNEVGFSISDGSAGDFARKVKDMHSNPRIREKFAQNCKKISRNYTWENTISKLVEQYENLSK